MRRGRGGARARREADQKCGSNFTRVSEASHPQCSTKYEASAQWMSCAGGGVRAHGSGGRGIGRGCDGLPSGSGPCTARGCGPGRIRGSQSPATGMPRSLARHAPPRPPLQSVRGGLAGSRPPPLDEHGRSEPHCASQDPHGVFDGSLSRGGVVGELQARSRGWRRFPPSCPPPRASSGVYARYRARRLISPRRPCRGRRKYVLSTLGIFRVLPSDHLLWRSRAQPMCCIKARRDGPFCSRRHKGVAA